VAFIFIPKIFGWAILLLILFPELLNVFFAYRSKKKIGVNPEANWIGKLKMVVQSVAFGAIFIGFFSGSPSWFSGALALLWISIVLAFLQLFFYPMRPVAVKTP
jgi:phosphatidylglycerophosphate synthase